MKDATILAALLALAMLVSVDADAQAPPNQPGGITSPTIGDAGPLPVDGPGKPPGYVPPPPQNNDCYREPGSLHWTCPNLDGPHVPDFGPHPQPGQSPAPAVESEVEAEDGCETPVGGLWGNPLEPGRGYAIDVQDDTIVVTAFGYTYDGQPSWWQLAGLLRDTGDCILAVRATVYYFYGGPAWYQPYRGVPDARPDEIAEFVFYSPVSGTVEYKGLILDIERQLFNAQ